MLRLRKRGREYSPDGGDYCQPGDGPVVALLLAPVELPGRSLRFSVTLDENLVERIDAVTSNRSAFLADAARAELRRRMSPI